MRMLGWRFLIIPLGFLAIGIMLWVYPERGWTETEPPPPPPTETTPSPGQMPGQTEGPVPLPADMPPIPDIPVLNEPAVPSPEEIPPGEIPPEEILTEEISDEPQGPTATDEILAPLEAGPTAEEEILAPIEEMEVTGDTLEGVAQQEYIVQEGDTLWDITHTYFTDSFLWPKIWKSNKTILNPDLIFPGNIILIPGEPGAPVFPPPEAPAVAAPAPRPPAAPPEAEAVEKEPSTQKPKEHRIEIVLPEVTSPQHFSLDLSTLPNPGYVVTKEEEVGKVVGARDGRKIIGEGETAYLLPRRGHRPEIGDQFTVYRVVRKVRHPKTGRNFGKLLRILGTVQVTHSKPEEKTLTAQVTHSLDFIQPGDRLMPKILKETTDSVSYSNTPETPLDGFILDVKEKRISQAEHDLVFLDRGRQHGLRIGNQLTIVRDGKRTPVLSPGKGVRLPSRTIGQLRVISVQDITATAMIIKSTEVIIRGDRFESPPQP